MSNSCWLKQCLYPDCTHEFPEHYISDYCGDHLFADPDRVIKSEEDTKDGYHAVQNSS